MQARRTLIRPKIWGCEAPQYLHGARKKAIASRKNYKTCWEFTKRHVGRNVFFLVTDHVTLEEVTNDY